MYYQSHFNTSLQLIKEFDGSVPLEHFLKNHFAANKKFGAKDRKYITGLCYTYFRLGHSLKDLPPDEKLLAGVFLCNNSPNDFLTHFRPEWNKVIHLSLSEKSSVLGQSFSVPDIFPWETALSAGIDHEKFCASLLVQPDLFLRIRPGCEDLVRGKLSDHDIFFKQIDSSCLALPNSTRIDQVLKMNEEVVVQDYSSQQTASFFLPHGIPDTEKKLNAWDCCAGSGGKSIMLYDLHRNITLTVSDIRQSVLANLTKRFAQAGIPKYKSFLTDLAHPMSRIVEQADLVIADLPCTGSGTWSRTPEALFFFKESQLARFHELQKKILDRIMRGLKKRGRLVYITCSVFRKENEEIVDFIQSDAKLKLEKMEILRGYDKKADTMFAAAFNS